MDKKKELKLVSLDIENFKGLEKIKLTPGKVLRIAGKNGVGKTTIADAYSWLMTGKDTLEQATFDIKPTNKNNEAIHHLITKVEAEFSFNGKPLSLKKEYKEEWTTKRGEKEPSLTSHKTIYYYDGARVSEKEYKSKLEEIINPELLKIVTNPKYFISVLKPDKRRAALYRLINTLSEDDILKNNAKFKQLQEEKRSLSVEEYHKSIKPRMSELDKQIKSAAPRIDENRMKITEVEDIEYYEHRIKNLDMFIDKELDIINSIKSDNGMLELMKKKQIILAKIKEEELKHDEEQAMQRAEIQNKNAEISWQIQELKNKIDEGEHELNHIETTIANILTDLERLRSEYYDIKRAEPAELAEYETTCPTCGRDYPPEKIDTLKKELIEGHKEWQARELERNTEKGLALKERENEYQKRREELLGLLSERRNKLREIQNKRETMPEFVPTEFKSVYTSELKAIESKIANATAPEEEIKEHELKIEEYKKEREECYSNIKRAELNKEIENRIAEIEKEAETAAKEYAKLRVMADLVEDFYRYQAEQIEEKVNGLFSFCKWKLFELQMNGGIKQICEVMVDGIPYRSMNEGSRKKAGLDVINVFSKHYGIVAPIILDEAGELDYIPQTDGQQIQLYRTYDETLSIMDEDDYARYQEYRTDKPIKG